MISIFTIPKGFRGADDVRQRNAIGSWRRLPGAEVILCGDDPGVGDVAQELGCLHIPKIRSNEFGTPYLSDAFAAAIGRARFETVCYANCDIILPHTFREVVPLLPERPFVAISRRINFDFHDAIDFSRPDWSALVLEHARRHGSDGGDFSIDVMVFRRDGPLTQLPDFVVGRPGWDNWFLWNADRMGAWIIDLSPRTRILHQNHEYEHVKGRTGKKWQGPEGDENRRLMGDPKARAYCLQHATHVVTRWGVRRSLDPQRVRRQLARKLRAHPLSGPVVERIRQALGRGHHT